MKFCAIIVAAVLCATAWGLDHQVTSSLTFDEAGAKNRPVSKVVTLLKDMLKQLEKEAAEDEEIYDKLACWCETNDKEKTKAIADAEARVARLTSSVEELTASSARLTTEIENLKTEIKANQASLDQATSLRQKQIAEYNEEEKDLVESITALKAAVAVLSKHHSFMQLPRSHVLGIAASIQHEMRKQASRLVGVLTRHERNVIAAFVQSIENSDATATSKQGYTPASGEVFGILKQMKETFETNLAGAQKEEAANQQAYEDLKAAKVAEIEAGEAQVDSKTDELASSDEKKAQALEDIADTKTSVDADAKFLAMLKDKCTVTDAEWEERQKTRSLEMEAVSKALAVLSDDDAHDLFTKTFNFMQEGSMASDRRAAASKVLSAASEKFQNPRLATLAVRVRLDAFERVKKAIDDMVVQLIKEKEEEIKHKDFCVGELNENQLTTESKEHAKANLAAKISDLEMTIKTLTGEIATLKSEVTELTMQLKRAGEDREKQNVEFQETIADQRQTQVLLKQAIDILKSFYAKAEAAALLQHKKQEPPAGFDTYKTSAASTGVISMLEQILADAKAMEKDAVHDEASAQKAYEKLVAETNASTEAKNKSIIHKSGTKAQAEKDLVAAKEDHADVVLELEQLANAKGELHTSCDFVIKNFEIRQTARDEEVEALKQAKAILSGAKFEQFLQAD